MYYICKFSDSWSIYDENKGGSRLMKKEEVEVLENLCPSLFVESNSILTAIEIVPIQANKLMKKTAGKKTAIVKKAQDPISKGTTNAN